MVSEQWTAAGDAGRDVYVLPQLRRLATAAAERVAASKVGTIKLVGGDDDAYGAVLASHPTAVGRVLRETGLAMGIDIDRLLTGEVAAPTGSGKPRQQRALGTGATPTPNQLSASAKPAGRSGREGSL